MNGSYFDVILVILHLNSLMHLLSEDSQDIPVILDHARL